MVSGCCFLIKTQVIKQIGLLDPDYFFFYEETDYCVRARKAGYTVTVVPSAGIRHKGGASASIVSGFQESQLIKNRFLFVRKNGTLIQKLTTFCYVSLLYLWIRMLKLATVGPRANIKALIRGYFQGVSCLL